MKYRISEYFSKDNSQSFSIEEFQWKKKLNEETVYISGKINIVEKLNSNKKFALDKILDKFLGVDNGVKMPLYDGEVDCTQSSKDVLEIALNMSELAENYRQKFKLDSSMSMTDIFSYIDNESKKYKERLEKVYTKFNNLQFDKKKVDIKEEKDVKKKENIEEIE